ncbi:low affinity iron permease family protein [Bosea sp. RAC05]|uniref:low affinity iron permease family protein n=1 Tax=Bosea sp. RAC05 TaxID=1842539 RepID=UPI00083D8C38|nr:low affinity iron permease family protein [Bosea sp. RAC05]AOG03193.1 low affinity iron permease family protein [Bosea sp. RAC05]
MRIYITNRFEALSEWISANLGSPYAFALASFMVVAWALSGPFFGYSDTWQLVINTSTTICTFLMVFLLQNTGNRTIVEMQDRLKDLEAINRELLHELRRRPAQNEPLKEAA